MIRDTNRYYFDSEFMPQDTSSYGVSPLAAVAAESTAAPANGGALTQLYQDVFKRAPDPSGYDFWLNAMNTMGYTPEMVRSEFLKSPEYQSMQVPAPVPSPAPAPVYASAAPTPAPAPVSALQQAAAPAPIYSQSDVTATVGRYLDRGYSAEELRDLAISQGITPSQFDTAVAAYSPAPAPEPPPAPAPAPAAAPTPAPAPAPAAGALSQAAKPAIDTSQPQNLLSNIFSADPNAAARLAASRSEAFDRGEASTFSDPGERFGEFTVKALGTGYDFEGKPIGGGYSASKTETGPNGKPIETTLTYDDKGGVMGSEVRVFTGGDSGVVYYYDASGKLIGQPKGFDYSEEWKKPVGTIFSMIAPALGPYGMLANAAFQASQGNTLGALASVAGAGAGFAGGFDLGTGTMTTPGGTFGGISQGTFSNIAAGANTANALKSGNWAGALSSIASSSLGANALGTQIGDTGFTLGDAAKGASALMALQSGQYGQALTSLGQLANSNDTVIAGRALSLAQAIESKNPNAITNAFQQFSAAMSDPGRISRLPSTVPGTTTTTLPALNATGLSNVDDLGLSTYINAINTLGATTDEALAAANAAMNRATETVNTQNAIENATTFDDAFAKARAAYGPGKTFTWQGKDYTTSTRAEDPTLAAASDAARQAAVGAGGGRGTAAGTTAAQAGTLAGVPLRTDTAATTGNQVFETAQYDALGNLIGGTAYNTAGVDTTTGLGKVGSTAADIINTASKMVGTYGPSAVAAGANLLSNVGGTIDLVAGRSTDVGNYLRDSAARINTFVDSISDPDVKAGQQRIGDAIDSAQGFGNKVIALATSMAQNPVSAFNWILTEAFEEVPGVGMALKAGNVLGKYGIMGVSVVNDMIESGGGAYNDTYASAIQQGMSESEARAAARNSALASMLATGVTQGVVEGKILTKVAGKETVGEGVEGAAQSAASQLALTGTIDPNKVMKDALIEAAVGKGASSAASGVTATNIGAGAGAATTTGAGTGATTGATTGTTTGTGGVSTLTGTGGTTTTGITGGNISTGGLGLTGVDTGGLNATAIVNNYVNTVLQGGDASTAAGTSVGNIVNTAITSGGDVGQAASTAVSSIIGSAASTGANLSSVTSSSVSSAVSTAATGGGNVAAATTGAVNSAVTSAVNSGLDVTTAVNSAVNGAITGAVSSNTNVASTINSAVGSAVTSATTAGANATTAITSTVNSAVTSAVNSGVDANTAVTSTVNSAVTSAVNSGVDTNTAVSTAVNSAVTSAVNSGVDTNVAVNSAVNSAVNAAVTAGVDTNTAVATAVNSAVNAAVTAGVDTNTTIAAAVTAAVNAGVDANVAVQVAVDAAVNAGVDANVATNIASKVDIPTVTPGTPPGGIATLPPPGAPSMVPGQIVTGGTTPTVTTPAPAPAPAVVAPKATTPAPAPAPSYGGYSPALAAAPATGSYTPTSPRETWTGGMFRQNIPAAPNLAALAALFGVLPQQQESQALSALQQASGVTPAGSDYFSYGSEPSPSEVIGSYRKGGNVQDGGSGDKMLSSPLMAAAGGDVPHKGSHYVQGAGGGQDDLIPAKLADGEYVFDAEIVAALGDGSNKEGAKKLDAMREAIRKHKRSGSTKTIPPMAKSPLQYLKEATK